MLCCNVGVIFFSRWFVGGSLVSAFIPIVPLVDIYFPFFVVPEKTDLAALSESATWILLILSGLFYTVGSLAFVRAFEDPPLPPLFKWYHLSTDELVAAWLFLLAALPSVPYALFFLGTNPTSHEYWGLLGASILFVLGSYGFVYTCYPCEKPEVNC